MEPNKLLAKWLETAEVSAAELARRCEYDRSNFGKILKGRLRPTLDLAVSIERETAGEIPVAVWSKAA